MNTETSAIENKQIAFEPLLSAEQACKLLGGIHIKTIQRYARAGQIPAHRIFDRWLFRASELNQWLQTGGQPVRTLKETNVIQ